MNGIEVRLDGKGASSVFKAKNEVRGKGAGIGPSIAAARELRGLTLDQLADRSGISSEELQMIESGKEEPAPAMLLAIANGLAMKLEMAFDTKPEVTMSVKFKG